MAVAGVSGASGGGAVRRLSRSTKSVTGGLFTDERG